ncbi:MEF2BNB-like protein [Wolffia australiana]
MHGLSAADGFLDVNQGVEDMIKFAANEPSAGLYYVQLHARNSVPNVLELKDKIVEKTHNMMLQTEDSEDSITCVRSMSECSFLIIHEMLRDINKSLHLLSTAQPHKGLLRSSSRGSYTQIGVSSMTHDQTLGGNEQVGYLSSVFSSVKQRASMLRRPLVDSMPESHTMASSSTPSSSMGDVSATHGYLEAEGEELPMSSEIADESNTGKQLAVDVLEPTLDTFEKFKLEHEAKLEQWLEEC